MSKVSIQGDANGTADFTLKAPNSNVDRTLNLPDEAGTVLPNVSDIESQVKTATNATGSAPVYACRAWVNFDGTNTTIRDSGNVSSITDIATGRYFINLTSNMPDSNYAISSTAGHIPGVSGTMFGTFRTAPGDEPTVSKYAVEARDANDGSSKDVSYFVSAVFR